MIKFICPNCKEDSCIVEFATNMSASTTFNPNSLKQSGVIDDYFNDTEYYGGEPEEYYCQNCGKVILDDDGFTITSPEDLYAYLVSRPYNKGE